MDDRYFHFAERPDQLGVCNRHSDEVFGFIRRFLFLLHMHPGTLVANICHFKQELV